MSRCDVVMSTDIVQRGLYYVVHMEDHDCCRCEIASFQLLLHSAIVLYTTTPHSPVKRARHKSQAKELYAA
jgi:hypothetical protein